MDTETELEIEVISRDGSIQDGHLILAERTQPERLKAAIRSFAIFALLAVAAAFIPVLHFILVPLCTVGAFFMAFNSYFDSHEIESGELICSQCKTKHLVEARSEIYPLVYECDKCGSRLTGYRRSGSLDD